MKKLILFTIDYPPMRGGVARYLSALVTHFGDKVTVIAPPEHQLLSKWFWPKWVKTIFLILKLSSKDDVVLTSHILPIGLACRCAALVTHRKYVVFLHGMDFALARRNRLKRVITKWILKGAVLVVTNTEALAREVRGFVKVRDLTVVHPCLSEDLLRVGASLDRPAKQEAINLLTVARLVPRKGHSIVLDALASIRDQGFPIPLRYYIVGDGPRYRELQEHVKALKLQDQVIFSRNASDEQLLEYYKNADVFVMPTEHMGRDIEGFGTVYIEAAAFGVPSIASELPGVDEAVLHDETGVLVPSNSVTDLAVAIQRLATDAELRGRLGSNAQARAQAEFHCDTQFAKLDHLL